MLKRVSGTQVGGSATNVKTLVKELTKQMAIFENEGIGPNSTETEKHLLHPYSVSPANWEKLKMSRVLAI